MISGTRFLALVLGGNGLQGGAHGGDGEGLPEGAVQAAILGLFGLFGQHVKRTAVGEPVDAKVTVERKNSSISECFGDGNDGRVRQVHRDILIEMHQLGHPPALQVAVFVKPDHSAV
jgi:hypothetical protein